MNLETARGIAARIWGDPDYSRVIMNPAVAEQIAHLLMDEANWQEAAGTLMVGNVTFDAPTMTIIPLSECVGA